MSRSSVSSRRVDPHELSLPDGEVSPEETPDNQIPGQDGRSRHRLRWLFFRIAASAFAATTFLVFEMTLGMPLSFAGTMLLATLVAAGLPLLISALPDKSESARKTGPRARYVLTCIVLSGVFALASLIS